MSGSPGPLPRVLLLFSLVLASPEASPSKPPHPGGIFSRHFNVSAVRRRGSITNVSRGVFQTGYGGLQHPTLLMAAAQVVRSQDGARVTFVGWNNPLTKEVHRWLIVETDSAKRSSFQAAFGEEGSSCVSYTDSDPRGYFDPFSKVFSICPP